MTFMQLDELISTQAASSLADNQDKERTYICIDLKTFYASVECVERGLDPFKQNLIVADMSRGRSTICLAISPAMKQLGIRNRCRVFEIPDGIGYIAAKPRMRRYMEVSAKIYGIYLEYVSAQDIHVYSIDECFIDATPYLTLYQITAREFANRLRGAVLKQTGITATAGIGPNLFLAKVALDISAKHAEDGIGVLDEERFKKDIWPHRPITDIWGIGPGIAERLSKYHVYDLVGVAALDQNILYKEFGVNAEYLIDHAHGYEPCTIAEIKAYAPQRTSASRGQVLARNYTFKEAQTILREMVEASVLDLVEKQLVTGEISIFVGYGTTDEEKRTKTRGPVFIGEHGARPRGGHRFYDHAGKQRRLGEHTNSRKKLLGYFDQLFIDCVDSSRVIKRINIGMGNLLPEEFATLDLFTDVAAEAQERNLQRAIIGVKGRYGKNALIMGRSLRAEATGRERNEQVGGHHA